MYLNWYFFIINIYIVVVGYNNNDKFNATFYNNLTLKIVSEFDYV